MTVHEIKIELDLPDDTVQADVKFFYFPEEKEVTYYPDGSGYPGCAAQVEIISIKCPHHAFDGYDLNDEDNEFIIDECYQYIGNE